MPIKVVSNMKKYTDLTAEEVLYMGLFSIVAFMSAVYEIAV
jgi:hypothetical protein